MNVKIVLILSAILAILGGAGAAFKDIHDIRNAEVAREAREQAVMQEAIRDREEALKAAAAFDREMAGMETALRNARPFRTLGVGVPPVLPSEPPANVAGRKGGQR